MNVVLDSLKTRRSIRGYDPDRMPAEELIGLDEPNGFHLFPHTFATLLYDLPNRKSSVRHGPVFLSFPGNYRTHRA